MDGEGEIGLQADFMQCSDRQATSGRRVERVTTLQYLDSQRPVCNVGSSTQRKDMPTFCHAVLIQQRQFSFTNEVVCAQKSRNKVISLSILLYRHKVNFMILVRCVVKLKTMSHGSALKFIADNSALL